MVYVCSEDSASFSNLESSESSPMPHLLISRASKAVPPKLARTFSDIASVGGNKENTAPAGCGGRFAPALVSSRLMSTEFSALGADSSGSHSQRSTQTASASAMAVTQVGHPDGNSHRHKSGCLLR